MNIFRTQLCAALCGVVCSSGLFVLSSTAHASEEDARSKTVRFDDLKLDNPAGAKALYHRIRLAARQVCDQSESGDALMREVVHRCIDKAIDDAVLHVHAPLLTTLRFGADMRLASE